MIEHYSKDRARDYVVNLWVSILGRAPSDADCEYILQHITNEEDAINYAMTICNCPEAIARRDRHSKIQEFVPPGHYYSAIVDPSALRLSSFETTRNSDPVRGIKIDWEKMKSTFSKVIDAQSDIAFPDTPTPEYRYYAQNEMFPLGDAMILAGMLRTYSPKRIIEIGSGYSSSVVLDTVDRTDGLRPSITFIEPNTERLEGLLRESDRSHIKIMKIGAQDVPLSVFEELDAGDILFLDTTHVAKTGSDVNYEFFHILPILKSGVLIHIHDIFDSFEYPDHWIYAENRSWNEIYMLRSFLMYNNEFEVILANSEIYTREKLLVAEKTPTLLGRPGSGFWIMRK